MVFCIFLFCLALNCQKQETEFETALKDLANGSLTYIDPAFCSTTLTSIIEDLILPSTLASDYLASQVIIINEIEYSLPLIRNCDFENDLLNKDEISIPTSPFVDFNDLDDYLKRCERKFRNFFIDLKLIFYLIRYDNNHSILSNSTVSSFINVLSTISSLPISILLFSTSSIIRCE